MRPANWKVPCQTFYICCDLHRLLQHLNRLLVGQNPTGCFFQASLEHLVEQKSAKVSGHILGLVGDPILENTASQYYFWAIKASNHIDDPDEWLKVSSIELDGLHACKWLFKEWILSVITANNNRVPERVHFTSSGVEQWSQAGMHHLRLQVLLAVAFLQFQLLPFKEILQPLEVREIAREDHHAAVVDFVMACGVLHAVRLAGKNAAIAGNEHTTVKCDRHHGWADKRWVPSIQHRNWMNPLYFIKQTNVVFLTGTPCPCASSIGA